MKVNKEVKDCFVEIYIGGDLPKVNQWNMVPKKKQYSFNALFMQLHAVFNK